MLSIEKKKKTRFFGKFEKICRQVRIRSDLLKYMFKAGSHLPKKLVLFGSMKAL